MKKTNKRERMMFLISKKIGLEKIYNIYSINRRQTHEEHLQRTKHMDILTKWKESRTKTCIKSWSNMRKEILDSLV